MLGLAYLTLARPELAAVSPLWKVIRWSAHDLLAEDSGVCRLRLKGTGLSIGADRDGLIFRSDDIRYEFRESVPALKADPTPGFAMTQKSLWFRDYSSREPGAAERKFLLGIRRVDGFPARLLGWLAVLVLSLPFLPRKWKFVAIKKDHLPVLAGKIPGSEIDQALDAVLLWLSLIPGAILLTGYTLSAFGQLNSSLGWLLGSGTAVIILACAAATLKRAKPGVWPGIPRGLARSLIGQVRNEFRAAPFRGSLVALLFIILMVVQIAQVTVAVFLAPTEYDSLTYILPRLACYLQHGSLDYFNSNFIAMTVHLKGATLLQIFAFIASGRLENATQLIALGASWTALIGVFGISRILTGRILPSVGAAAVTGLTTNFMMIAVTPQLDMPLTGFFAISLYFLGRWLQSPGRALPPVVAAMTFCMALGYKASALLLVPSMGVVLVLCLVRSKSRPAEVKGSSVKFATAWIFGTLLFVLPAGYVENLRHYGDIMGPESWCRAHIMPGNSPAEFFSEGLRNTARYVIHFVSLDGLPRSPWTIAVQNKLREPLLSLASFAGLNLEQRGPERQSFSPRDYSAPHENLSFAGPAFIILLIPGVFAAFLRIPNRSLVATLAAGAVLYILAQSFLSRYDPWRGRSFVNLTIMLAPLAASLFCLNSSNAGRVTTAGGSVLLALACIVSAGAGLNSGFFRNSSPLYSRPGTIMFEGSILGQHDRLWQLCRSNPQFLDRLRRLEAEIPRRSLVATSGFQPDLQYPVFGEKLARQIIYLEKDQVPPASAYVLFSPELDSQRDDRPFRKPHSGPPVSFAKITLVESDLPLDLLEETPDKRGRLYLRKP
ncbi:MAG: hypothetical protein WCN98_02935 [Verrucomicrobiaceae bacterium]